MSITLTVEEQARFIATQRAMLELDPSEPEAWEREVCRQLKALLGADRAGFFATTGRPELEFSEDYSADVMDAYRGYYAARDPGHQKLRAEKRPVFTRAMLFDGDVSPLRSTECYNDFFIPNGMEDSAGFTLPSLRPGAGSPGILALHRGEFGSESFARRAPVLLGLLAPSFRQGFLTRHRLRSHLAGLDRMIDVLEQPAGLYRLDGRLRHANPRLRDGLAGPGRARRRREVERAVKAAARTRRPGASLEETVRAGSGAAAPAAVLLESLGPEPLLLVLLPPRQPAVPSADRLRRLNLTQRQAQVARLLAARKTNVEVAEALGISPHTARSHTEAVMAKLDVRSRRDVADVLLAAADA